MKLKHSKLSHFQSNKLLEYFIVGAPARTAADLVGVNRHTAHDFFHKLREIIAWQIEEEWQFSGEIEVDESYFGGRRKGKRGRGAAGKSLFLAFSSVVGACIRKSSRMPLQRP